VRFAFRVDIGNLITLRVPDADAQILTQWVRLVAQNMDLLVAWALVWVVAHLTMVGIGAILIGPNHGAPAFVVVPVEVIPGFFVALGGIRLGIAMRMTYRVIIAVGDARGASRPPPAWTQRRGLLVELTTPRDWDIVPALVLVAVLLQLIK